MKILVVQTAFIGDVILATAVLEKLHAKFPDAQIDFLVQKGNEQLFVDHPFLNDVLVFAKNDGKLAALWKIIRHVRSIGYDVVINLHRFFSSGLITVLSGAKQTMGFQKNPLSRLYSLSVPHEIDPKDGVHEVNRNQRVIAGLTDDQPAKPRLYPTTEIFQKVARLEPYVCIAPASIWFTKQWPESSWVELIRMLDDRFLVCLLGSKQDITLCERIAKASAMQRVEVLAGTLSLLESAALMHGAKMNYVNDSAPMHLASAMNAPVTAIYCSTVPGFGFGPLSDHAKVVETKEQLECRPCGLHGYVACPLGHFKCAQISVQEVI